MRGPRHNLDKSHACWHLHQHRNEPIRCCAITHLATILSPTVGHTSGCQGAGVIPASTNGIKRHASGHRRHGRSGCVGGGAISDLPGGVPPPAVGNAPCGKCTDRIATHTYRSKGYASGHRHCYRRGAIGGCAITQLPKGVVSPAIGDSTGSKRTRRVSTGSQTTKAYPRRHSHRHGNATFRRCPIPELVGTIDTPTVDITTGSEGTGVIHTHYDGDKGDPSGHADRNRSCAIVCGAVAELTKDVVAPAVGLATSRQGTGMGESCVDNDKGNPGRHGYCDRCVTPRGRAVAELTKHVAAPTKRCACCGNRTRTIGTRANTCENTPRVARRCRGTGWTERVGGSACIGSRARIGGSACVGGSGSTSNADAGGDGVLHIVACP